MSERGIVIGYDGYKNSRAFAEDAACVMIGLGFRVVLFDRECAAALLARSVAVLDAAAGVMFFGGQGSPLVGGCEVYWTDGTQLSASHAEGIAAAIERVLGAAYRCAPKFCDVPGGDAADGDRLTWPPPDIWAESIDR